MRLGSNPAGGLFISWPRWACSEVPFSMSGEGEGENGEPVSRDPVFNVVGVVDVVRLSKQRNLMKDSRWSHSSADWGLNARIPQDSQTVWLCLADCRSGVHPAPQPSPSHHNPFPVSLFPLIAFVGLWLAHLRAAQARVSRTSGVPEIGVIARTGLDLTEIASWSMSLPATVGPSLQPFSD